MVPHTAHMMRHRPTEPDLSRALAGDTKMPDPVEHKKVHQQFDYEAFSLFSLSLSLSFINCLQIHTIKEILQY